MGWKHALDAVEASRRDDSGATQNIQPAVDRMLADDEKAFAQAKEGRNRFMGWACCCCQAFLDAFELEKSMFGMPFAQHEVDELLSTGYSEEEAEAIASDALFIGRRRRFCGESNILIMADPMKTDSYGHRFPFISIIRLSRMCCDVAIRRVCLDARYVTQVEVQDDIAMCEIAIESVVLSFGVICLVIIWLSEPETDNQEVLRDWALLILFGSCISMFIVLVMNFINAWYFRAVRVVVDLATKNRVMVTNKRIFSNGSRVENSANNSALQFQVTLTAVSAYEARRLLQAWKTIADNIDLCGEEGRMYYRYFQNSTLSSILHHSGYEPRLFTASGEDGNLPLLNVEDLQRLQAHMGSPVPVAAVRSEPSTGTGQSAPRTSTPYRHRGMGTGTSPVAVSVERAMKWEDRAAPLPAHAPIPGLESVGAMLQTVGQSVGSFVGGRAGEEGGRGAPDGQGWGHSGHRAAPGAHRPTQRPTRSSPLVAHGHGHPTSYTPTSLAARAEQSSGRPDADHGDAGNMDSS